MDNNAFLVLDSRSPHGERGLKFALWDCTYKADGSLPSRGAWIEIGLHHRLRRGGQVAPLTGSVD